MRATLRVRRYDPETQPTPTYKEYPVDLPQYGTVLDGLLDVRDRQDGTLSLRCSCRSAICGSCSMRINGEARLACKTLVNKIASPGETITVEPMGNMPVIKDLVADMTLFWDKVRAVEPYLQPVGPAPEREYLVSNEAMERLTVAMNCIMCGACVSDCTVLEVDKTFLGPAALAKAYRFVDDPRDGRKMERLEKYTQTSGIWDCTRCNMCVQVCPKGVAPMERIMQVRSMAMEAGFNKTRGARHASAFAEIVKESGRLDEMGLALKTYGFFKAGFTLTGIGLRAFFRNKLPPLFHRPIATAENVRRLFRRLGV
ncbi:MAG: succinate dehydrogenase iron-sulfur subunit [Chloroflexi bacterium]|nr:succinate dehydrogenase iron-sulfur subunit [Chloroflexota bacterium]